MNNNKEYYGNAVIKEAEVPNNSEIKLEYYKTARDNKYGIQVVKTELKDKIEKREKIELDNITEREDLIESLLNEICKHKVTPIIVEDIVQDYMYVFQC